MSDYESFLDSKAFDDVSAGFDVEPCNPNLFDFQRVITKWAIRRGRAAVFADTGLGKTIMAASWCEEVVDHTCHPVIILAPLAVAKQTVQEAAKFGIEITYLREPVDGVQPDITITNYEMMEHFDPDAYVGVVLDESSILKHQQSKTRERIIAAFRETPYRLSCTATPSPNDYMELGNQAEFLGIMSAAEMLAMFFTHDGGETSKWRLKNHGKVRFWEWLSTWSVVLRKPSDLGYSDDGYDLPGLNIIDHVVESERMEGELFPKVAESLQDRRRAQRATVDDRVRVVADLVNQSDEPWIIWCQLNDEGDALRRQISDAVEVRGADSIDEKEQRLSAFSRGKIRVIVTKSKISGFGMNWQHCANMAFVGISDSFEQFYQSVRRCYRFGQTRVVNVHLVHAQSEGAVKANLERKQSQHDALSENMVAHMRTLMQQKIGAATMEKTPYVRDIAEGDGWTLHLADCIDVAREQQENSIDFSVFSPPFSSLYTYSNSDRDMGNTRSHGEFYEHISFLAIELFRIMKPGRNCSFHCMNLPTSKMRDGVIGLTDFRGDLIRIFQDVGWIYHSEVTIWKDPVTAMQRTKALGLLHKQIKKDSAMSRQGIPDYLVTMRKPGENKEPVSHTNDTFPVSRWQEWASPVWMDIKMSDTLQFRNARDNDDERHIAPLQLQVIERALCLWSNPGDLVFSPFVGIGSEGYQSLRYGRRFLGAELKPSYFEVAKKNLESAKIKQDDLFGVAV